MKSSEQPFNLFSLALPSLRLNNIMQGWYPKQVSSFILLLCLTLIVMVLSLLTGPTQIPLDVFLSFVVNDTGEISPSAEQLMQIVMQLRAPRVLLALAIGANLALCGAVIQGMFRNPLADPGLIGISSGASLGAVLMIVLGQSLFAAAFSLLGPHAIAIGAFGGGLLCTCLVIGIGELSQGRSSSQLLLAGIAINSLTGAIIGLLTYFADDMMLRDLTFWSLGSIGGANWQLLGLVFTVLILTSLVFFIHAQKLNALLLGEAEAAHLGIDVTALKRQLILATALSIGVSVSTTGLIGFVGLVVPHLVRMAISANYRVLLPFSMVTGGLLLLIADTFARQIIAPAELPIGIITALIGAPYFLYLILRHKNTIIF